MREQHGEVLSPVIEIERIDKVGLTSRKHLKSRTAGNVILEILLVVKYYSQRKSTLQELNYLNTLS